MRNFSFFILPAFKNIISDVINETYIYSLKLSMKVLSQYVVYKKLRSLKFIHEQYEQQDIG